MSIQIEDLQKQTVNVPVLGSLLWWRNAGISASSADVHRIFNQYGFMKYVPQPISPLVAFDRAVMAWMSHYKYKKNSTATQKTDDTKVRKFYTKVVTTDYIVYVMINQLVTFNDFTLDHNTEFRVTLNRKTDEVTVTAGPRQPMPIDPQYIQLIMTEQLKPFYAVAKDTYISTDFSQVFRDIVLQDLGAVRTGRLEGPPYFCTVEKQEELDKFCDMVETLPVKGKTPAHVFALPQIDMKRTRKELALGIHQGVLDDVSALESALAETQLRHGAISEEKFAELIVRYKETSAKVQAYASKLDSDMSDALTRIDTLKSTVMELIQTAPTRDELHRRPRTPHVAKQVNP